MTRTFLLPLRALAHPVLAVLPACMLLLALPVLSTAAEPLDELRQADFFTVEDVRAEVPYGELHIRRGVVAIFRGLDRRMTGMLIGEADARLDSLPLTGALNQFASSGHGTDALRFTVSMAFLSAALHSGAEVLSEGRVLALRRWEQLSRSERQRFEDGFLQAFADSWVSPGAAQTGAPRLRDPVGKEFYAAFWAEPVALKPLEATVDAGATEDMQQPGPAELGESDDAVRYDMRVDAAGEEVTISDYLRELMLFQWSDRPGLSAD